MQRCPKCGYRERFDWPSMLWVLSCCILYLVVILTEGYVPRTDRIWVITIGFFGFLLYIAGVLWRAYRIRMENAEYSRSQELQKLN